MARVAVIGAGVVGLACATQLRRRGHDVILIDPVPPGESCSLGNAGCLSRCSFVPLGMPGMWKKVPGWLLDPKGPLSIPMSYWRHAAPWAWRLLRNSSRAQVESIADALFPLLDPSVRLWRGLAAYAGVPELIRQDGYAFAYESSAAFDSDMLGRAIRSDRAVAIQILRGGEVHDLEPALSKRVTHLVFFPEQGHVPNPLRLSRALSSRLSEAGAVFVQRRATGFDIKGDRVARVFTDGDSVEAECVVIAGGAQSHLLTRQLGCPVMLETERGYHVMLEKPSRAPRFPVMSAEGKFFVTPMEMGLRVAGTVELAGLNAPPKFDRLEPLLDGARRLIPDLSYQEGSKWMGHRPSLPDSKPVIGRPNHLANVILAFGHGHVGLTAAPATAEIVSELADGRQPAVDLGPYSPHRREVRVGHR